MLIRSQKTFVYLILIALGATVAAGALAYFKVTTVWFWLGLILIANAAVLLVYYLRIYRVFGKIISQIEALLAGQKYKKIVLLRRDEFGLLAQFFNHVTKNLEAVSHDLKEGSRMLSELDLAADIQRSVLPATIPLVDKLDVAARTRPAEEVGGDSFGFMKKGNQTYIYLGDVTGHGAPAGLIMMMVNTLLAVYLDEVNSTSEWIVKTNRTLKPRVNSTMFMTTIALRWNPEEEKMYYTGAGHEHILIYRAKEGICEAIPTGGIALGMTDDVEGLALEKLIPLNKEDTIVLYTDGIPEARNKLGEMYTLERLKMSVAKNGSLGESKKLFEAISEDFRGFVKEEPQLDDITFLVLRYSGVPMGADQQGLLVDTAWNEAEADIKV